MGLWMSFNIEDGVTTRVVMQLSSPTIGKCNKVRYVAMLTNLSILNFSDDGL